MIFPPISRFAPSPTGRLHLGHAFSAIKAHDWARNGGGRFLLRIEDIDAGRSREAFVAGIEQDLAWLGLRWDGAVVRQSARLEAYRAPLGALGVAGVVYPGTCRRLDPAERARRMATEAHAWRLDMARAAALAGPLCWHDAVMGDVDAEPQRFGDVVLARKDAPASYHLAVTVDDAWQGVTDVVRGMDLYDATHIHRLLQALLGLPTPRYHHHPLLTDADGHRLAKRTGARALADWREAGEDGPALAEELRAGRVPALATS